MVLVHGGGGQAFAEWATLWAKRGYVAISMDLRGRGPDGNRHPDACRQGDRRSSPTSKTASAKRGPITPWRP